MRLLSRCQNSGIPGSLWSASENIFFVRIRRIGIQQCAITVPLELVPSKGGGDTGVLLAGSANISDDKVAKCDVRAPLRRLMNMVM